MEKEFESEIKDEIEVRVRHDFNTRVPGYRNFSLAITLPDPDTFLRAAADFILWKRPAILLGVGLSQVHPEDRPARKLGREAAIAAMKSAPVKIEAVYTQGANPPKITILLTPVRGISVLMTCSRGQVRLVEMICAKNIRLELEDNYRMASDERFVELEESSEDWDEGDGLKGLS